MILKDLKRRYNKENGVNWTPPSGAFEQKRDSDLFCHQDSVITQIEVFVCCGQV